jgi:hypothetical protein
VRETETNGLHWARPGQAFDDNSGHHCLKNAGGGELCGISSSSGGGSSGGGSSSSKVTASSIAAAAATAAAGLRVLLLRIIHATACALGCKRCTLRWQVERLGGLRPRSSCSLVQQLQVQRQVLQSTRAKKDIPLRQHGQVTKQRSGLCLQRHLEQLVPSPQAHA